MTLSHSASKLALANQITITDTSGLLLLMVYLLFVLLAIATE